MKFVPCQTINLLNINSILSSASISQTHPRLPWCLVVAVSIFGHLKDTAVTLCPSRSKRFYWLFGTTFSKQKKHSKNHFLTHWECVMPAELTFARASALEMSLTYIALMCWKRNLPKHLWLRRIMLCTSKLEEIWWARQKERSQPKLMILLTLSSAHFLWQLC